MCATVLVLACVQAILCCLYVFVWEQEREGEKEREHARARATEHVSLCCGCAPRCSYHRWGPRKLSKPISLAECEGSLVLASEVGWAHIKGSLSPGSVRQNNLTRLQERDLAAGGVGRMPICG